MNIFISCPKGLEYLLEEEVKDLGLEVSSVNPRGVYVKGDIETAYTLCLWSRIANRVYIELVADIVHHQKDIYEICRRFSWDTIFDITKTFRVDFDGTSEYIRNTMFGAQIVKDGIVDYFNAVNGKRPSIEKYYPNILIHAHLHKSKLTLSLDVSGYSLHERGYRLEAGEAPLKENIAAALLRRAQWHKRHLQGEAFYDPFCGSGTIAIEAAMMACQKAPGLLRRDQAIQYSLLHNPAIWEKTRSDAESKACSSQNTILGSDIDAAIIPRAKENAKRAGVEANVAFHVQDMIKIVAPPAATGILVANPPYGQRLGSVETLIPAYVEWGRILHTYFMGWDGYILTQEAILAKALGLRSHKQYTIHQGPIVCTLYAIAIRAENHLKHYHILPDGDKSDPVYMFTNRLQKNLTHLKKWAKKHHIEAYRVYDADLPEYAYAIDWYRDYAVVQEYAAPKTICPQKASSRRLAVLRVLPEALGLPHDHIVFKTREIQKGKAQYEKKKNTHRTIVVEEKGAKFLINLYDYLDTGIFLDTRPLRERFQSLPKGARFLNCFAYTATASVHAALAGCITTNVDMSATYMEWAKANFRLNHIVLDKHAFVQEDVLQWMKYAKGKFDVIYLDPPSFSNSKRMQGTLDIQRDHPSLITQAMDLLAPKGVLYFVTNLRSFKFSPELTTMFQVEDITAATIDEDFKRNSRIHRCYRMVHKCKSVSRSGKGAIVTCPTSLGGTTDS